MPLSLDDLEMGSAHSVQRHAIPKDTIKVPEGQRLCLAPNLSKAVNMLRVKLYKSSMI